MAEDYQRLCAQAARDAQPVPAQYQEHLRASGVKKVPIDQDSPEGRE
jgi:hypothetical protein